MPWVDSAWDTIHTAIRPIGGAFLAVKTLGQADPVFDIIVALLAGGVTLTVHGAKAGTRLVANGSPEPFSNIALSTAEDLGVVGGLGVMDYSYHHNPYVSLIVFGVIVLTLLYVTPKIFRFHAHPSLAVVEKTGLAACGREDRGHACRPSCRPTPTCCLRA